MKLAMMTCVALVLSAAMVWGADMVWEDPHNKSIEAQTWRIIEQGRQRNIDAQRDFDRQNAEIRMRETKRRNQELQRENERLQVEQQAPAYSHGHRVRKHSFEDDGDYRNW